ncbi:MAG: RDD family protein, partial [Promethearchaeota archaeon]
FWFATSFYNFLIGFCYFWLLEAFNKGQTVGKLALKLRTVDENSLEITTPAQYAINNISKATGFLILDVIIGILINSSAEEPARKRLRLTQNLARTAVIAEK